MITQNRPPKATGFPWRHGWRRGMTIAEVLVSLALAAIVVCALYSGTELAMRGTTANAQRVAAYGLCQDRFEQMRGHAFSDITVANYPTQSVQITTASGFNATGTVSGTISCTITNLASPSRKQVQIYLNWNFRSVNYQESLAGCIVDRNAAASLLGTVSGYLYLNPAGVNPLQFLLTFPDGSTQPFSTITNLSKTLSTIYNVRHVTVQVGGAGTQTTVQYNYQPLPMSNARQWDVDSTSTFRTSFKYDTTVTPASWRMRLTGQGVVISTR